jgi:hypothetical protein
MARALDESVRLGRRWFWAHLQRRHRCRSPETGEVGLCDCDRAARLVLTIRQLGRGHVAYQPVDIPGRNAPLIPAPSSRGLDRQIDQAQPCRCVV